MLRIPQSRLVLLLCLTIFTTVMASSLSFARQGESTQTISGKILTTMDSGGYTYLEVQSGAEKRWVAIPETTVKVGDDITYYEGMVMENFHSKTLDRTFDAILFSPGLVKAASGAPAPAAKNEGDDSFGAAVQAEKQNQGKAPQAMSGGSLGAIVPLEDTLTIEKATGPDSYTVEELHNKAKELNGKTVRVRGKVMKFSPLIMGRNWVHIQDGTGNPMHNSHDLVVTTDASVETGAVVTFTGVLAADKDFGAGYKYAVIIEQGSLVQ
jgi:hypothetical protein